MIFDSISAEIRKTIRDVPDGHWHPKPGSERIARQYIGRANHMFVAAKFSTTSSRLTALYSDMPTIGNFWIPVQTDGGDISKALTVWWNSTPVSMMLLNRRSRKLTYPDWSLEHLKEIKIPKSDNPYWPLLTETFESICNEEIQPLKDSRNDPVRQMIDDAAAKVLGLNASVLVGWRERLTAEPTVSNREYPTATASDGGAVGG